MLCRLWSETYWSLCASVSRPGCADIHPASVRAFCLNRSVPAGRASTAQTFMNPRSAPDCLFWRFSAEAPCSPHLSDPALAFWLNSGQVRQKDIQQKGVHGHKYCNLRQRPLLFSCNSFTFLSHCWCRYRSRMFVFSVTMTEERQHRHWLDYERRKAKRWSEVRGQLKSAPPTEGIILKETYYTVHADDLESY